MLLHAHSGHVDLPPPCMQTKVRKNSISLLHHLGTAYGVPSQAHEYRMTWSENTKAVLEDSVEGHSEMSNMLLKSRSYHRYGRRQSVTSNSGSGRSSPLGRTKEHKKTPPGLLPRPPGSGSRHKRTPSGSRLLALRAVSEDPPPRPPPPPVEQPWSRCTEGSRSAPRLSHLRSPSRTLARSASTPASVPTRQYTSDDQWTLGEEPRPPFSVSVDFSVLSKADQREEGARGTRRGSRAQTGPSPVHAPRFVLPPSASRRRLSFQHGDGPKERAAPTRVIGQWDVSWDLVRTPSSIADRIDTIPLRYQGVYLDRLGRQAAKEGKSITYDKGLPPPSALSITETELADLLLAEQSLGLDGGRLQNPLFSEGWS